MTHAAPPSREKALRGGRRSYSTLRLAPHLRIGVRFRSERCALQTVRRRDERRESMEKLRLLLLEPNKLVRAGIKKILCDLGVVVEKDAGGIQDALSYLEDGGRPDLILMEFDAECGSPMETLRSIRIAAPEAKIVALTTEIAPFSLVEALKAGSSGFLNKNISPKPFHHALHLVSP